MYSSIQQMYLDNFGRHKSHQSQHVIIEWVNIKRDLEIITYLSGQGVKYYVYGEGGRKLRRAASRPGCSRPAPHRAAPPRTPRAPRAGALSACARRPARQSNAAPRLSYTCVLHDKTRRLKRSNAHPQFLLPVTERATSRFKQNSFSSGNAFKPVRGAGWRRRPGGRPARVPTGAGVEHAEFGGEFTHGEPVGEPARLRAALRGPRQEVPEHDRVRPSTIIGTRSRDRRPTRLQDKGPAREDKHVHQDTGSRRGTGVRRHRPQGGRRASQARNPLGGRALLSDPRVAQMRGRATAAGRRARARHRPSPRPVPRRGTRRRSEGRHHQAHTAHHAHVHRDAIPRARAGVRGDRAAGERGGGAQGDRGAHRAAHGRGWRRRRARARRRRAARAALPRRARLAAAARAGGRLLVRRLVLVRRVVGAARGPARHLVVDGARRGARRVAVVRVAGRRAVRRVDVGPDAAVAGLVTGARLRRVRRARRGGGAGAVRTQPVLPGVRAAAGGGRRAVPGVLGARAPGDPHHLVRRPRVRREADESHVLVGIFFTRIVIKILKRKNRVIEILVPKSAPRRHGPSRRPAAAPRAGAARPPRRTYLKSAELFTIYFLIMNVFY